MATTQARAEEVKAHILASRPHARVQRIVEVFSDYFVVHVKCHRGCYDANLYIKTKSHWNRLAESTKDLTEVGGY